MFYYTPELERMKPDMEGMIDHLITQLNKAYKKSEIPIRAKKFCSERATFQDKRNMDKNYESFLVMKRRECRSGDRGCLRKALRNTADAAALLTTQRGEHLHWNKAKMSYSCERLTSLIIDDIKTPSSLDAAY